MKSAWALFVFLSATLMGQAHEFEHFPWLIKVQSTYQEKQGTRTYQGYGFVMEAGDRYYVVTAAHLSQGGVEEDRPTLRLEYFDQDEKKFKNLPYKVRVAHNRRDIELIHVARNPKISPLAAWQFPLFGGIFVYGKISVVEPWRSLLNDSAKEGDLFTRLGKHARLPKAEVLTKLIASPSNAKSEESLKSKDVGSHRSHLGALLGYGLDGTETEFSAFTHISAGMSGLPLLIRHQDEWVLGGVVTSSSRFFEEAWFARDTYVGYVVSRIQGLPDIPEATQNNYSIIGEIYWRSHEGLLYRHGLFMNLPGTKAGVHFQETVLSREVTGSSTRLDQGATTRSDGGATTRSDGGATTRSDGASGDASAETRKPRSLKEGVLFFEPGQAAAEVIAFQIRHRGEDYLIPGDMASIVWLAELVYSERMSWSAIKAIRADSKLLGDLAWKQWQRLFAKKKTNFLDRLWHSISPETKVAKEFSMERLRPLDRYEQGAAQVSLSSLGRGTLRVSIDLGFDLIGFDLGSQAELLGSADFQSEITVRGKSGKTYRLEVGRLLMVSPSKYRFDPHVPFTFLGPVTPNAQIKFRIKSADEEYLLSALD